MSQPVPIQICFIESINNNKEIPLCCIKHTCPLPRPALTSVLLAQEHEEFAVPILFEDRTAISPLVAKCRELN